MSMAWQQPGWGPPPAPPTPAPFRSPTHPGPRTDALAIWAIASAAAGTTILVGLGSIAAIVLGLIALSRIRRSGDDGRLLAVWAVILGAVTLVALIAATVAGIAMIVTVVGGMQGMPGV